MCLEVSCLPLRCDGKDGPDIRGRVALKLLCYAFPIQELMLHFPSLLPLSLPD